MVNKKATTTTTTTKQSEKVFSSLQEKYCALYFYKTMKPQQSLFASDCRIRREQSWLAAVSDKNSWDTSTERLH